jgi:glycosyltransferase involved in cell wall biosynthesis
MVLRGAVEDFPPTVHQANILAEMGIKVGLVDNKYGRFAAHEAVLNPAIKRISIKGWDSLREPPQRIWQRLWNFRTFGRVVSNALAGLNPRVVLAFDSSGFFFLGPAVRWPSRRRTIVHFHELPEMRADVSRGGRRDVRFAMVNSRYADEVVFPEPNRAAIFSKSAHLRRQPQIVVNCPRCLNVLPEGRLTEALSNQGIVGRKAVLYQGLIGGARGLHAVIKSILSWPKDAIFVLIGPGDAEEIAALKRLSVTVGVGDRVVILPPVSSAEIMTFTVGAHIGISLYEVIGENERFAASNKLMEYMAAGVPQITSVKDGVGMEPQGNWGIAVDPQSPGEIGNAVNAVLRDDDARLEMGRRARRAHLAKYNYEEQFAPVRKTIQSWVG